MKFLVLALDGGDARIIRALDMPFLQGLLARSTACSVEEDLWSRGWVEVLAGAHGRVSGGFYSKPKLDGTHAFTSSFGGGHYARNPALTPIWERAHAAGHAVGVMGVNTTFPPPAVDGFFIAGPGGGVPAGVEVPAAACYPSEMAAELNDRGYVWEVRFRSSGLTDVRAFFDLLRREAESRVQPFVDFCENHRVGLGIFHNKAPVVVQNLMMREIEALIQQNGAPQAPIQQEIVDLYRVLDATFEEVFERVQPEGYLVVSDHGAAPYRHAVHVNPLLQEAGLQVAARPLVSPKAAARRVANVLVPARRRRAEQRVQHSPTADWKRTRAFGTRYIYGVYVNDRERFGGPVRGERNVERVVTEVVDLINAAEPAQELGLHARPYRALHRSAPQQALLPDVWIDKPDEVFFEGNGPFVRENPLYRPVASLDGLYRDIITGIKGRHPLLYVDDETAGLVREDDPRDLTLAYRLMGRALCAVAA